MSISKVLILGENHLASRTKEILTTKGYSIIHLKENPTKSLHSEFSTLKEFEKAFNEFDMNSFSMTYVLFEKDEDNLEILISMMSLYPEIQMCTSLFNENLRPYLEKANPKLQIINPAKIAAPVFIADLESKINRKNKIQTKTISTKSKKKDTLLLKLIVTYCAIICFSVCYFHFFEQLSWINAFYFVVVTISTVGYGDFNMQNATTVSKIIDISLILSSMVFVWLIFSFLIERILKIRSENLLGRKKYKYSNHIIVCGLGRLGYYIAEELHKKGEKVIIIESNENNPSIDYFRNLKIDLYIGNASLPFVLQEVGVERCTALISVINDDFTNLEIGLNARYFQPNLRLILRIFDESIANVLKDKFDIHLSRSMSYIAAEKFASLI